MGESDLLERHRTAMLAVGKPEDLKAFFEAFDKMGAQITGIRVDVDYNLPKLTAAPLQQLQDIEKSDAFAKRLIPEAEAAQDQAAPPITDAPKLRGGARGVGVRGGKGRPTKSGSTSYQVGRKNKPVTLADALAGGFVPEKFESLSVKGSEPVLYLVVGKDKMHANYRVLDGKKVKGIPVDVLQQLRRAYPAIFEQAAKDGIKLPAQAPLPRAELKGGTCQIGLHASGELGSCDAMRAPHCKKHHDESHGDLLHTFVPAPVAAPIR